MEKEEQKEKMEDSPPPERTTLFHRARSRRIRTATPSGLAPRRAQSAQAERTYKLLHPAPFPSAPVLPMRYIWPPSPQPPVTVATSRRACSPAELMNRKNSASAQSPPPLCAGPRPVSSVARPPPSCRSLPPFHRPWDKCVNRLAHV